MRILIGIVFLFSGCRGTAPTALPDTQITFRHATLHPRDYEAFLIRPISIEIKKAETEPITAEELSILSQAFRESAVDALTESGYAVVGTPGPGVLALTVEITELETPHPIPTGQGDIQVKFDAGKRAALMTLHCEDAETGERVMTIVHTLRGAKYGFGTREKRLAAMLDAFKGWGHALLLRLREIRR